MSSDAVLALTRLDVQFLPAIADPSEVIKQRARATGQAREEQRTRLHDAFARAARSRRGLPNPPTPRDPLAGLRAAVERGEAVEAVEGAKRRQLWPSERGRGGRDGDFHQGPNCPQSNPG